ncbi:MAG: hypothetical protein N3F64_03875 [Nitrososphaeria archaeon]|nr:hypothetical protein [Nitrososphaeria archaeon]
MEDDTKEKLDWKDYIAIIIALLETVYLPIIILIFILFFAAIVFTLLAH